MYYIIIDPCNTQESFSSNEGHNNNPKAITTKKNLFSTALTQIETYLRFFKVQIATNYTYLEIHQKLEFKLKVVMYM